MPKSTIEVVPQPESYNNHENPVIDTESADGLLAFNLEIQRKPRWERLIEHGKQLGQIACAFIEVSPANEAIRLGVFGGVMASVSRSPEAGAISYGLSTLLVEGIGVVAAAPLLETNLSKKFVNMLNNKIAKFRKNEDSLKLSPLSKATAAFLGGSVLSMSIEQLEDNTRNIEQNVHFGLKVSAALAGVCAVQGALMSEGINLGIDHPQVFGPIAGVTALAAGSRYIHKRFFHKEDLKMADKSTNTIEN